MVWGQESIGHRVRHLRKQLGISQEELGKKCDLSGNTINRIENDIMDIVVYRDYLDRIAKALGVSASDIEITNGQRGTRHLLDIMFENGELSKEEAEGVYAMANVKLRSNAAAPLGRNEILSILEVYKSLQE